MLPRETRHAIEHECARQIYRYANTNDAGDWEALAAFFTEDGVFARPSAPDSRVTGRQAILDSFTARPARFGRHLITNLVVDVISETEATAFSVIVLYQGKEPSPEGVHAHALDNPFVGEFRDRLVLRDGEWKFAERLGRLVIR